MNNQAQGIGPIGVFDSGYGGLTILDAIRKKLPQYDYLYLGDNARAPYGPRSFNIVYRFTLEAVKYLFDQGCHLVILACNTASAKALRNIQLNEYLALFAPQSKRLARFLTQVISVFLAPLELSKVNPTISKSKRYTLHSKFSLKVALFGFHWLKILKRMAMVPTISYTNTSTNYCNKATTLIV